MRRMKGGRKNGGKKKKDVGRREEDATFRLPAVFFNHYHCLAFVSIQKSKSHTSYQ